MSKSSMLITLSLVCAVSLHTNGADAPATHPTRPRAVFHHEWIGNIDKASFNEPSGICWHPQRKTLFVVGDEGDVCEIKTDGTPVKRKKIYRADFEGITCDPSSGLLYIAVEGTESIIELDPGTFDVRRGFSLPRTYRGTTVMQAGGQGIEAITFVPAPANTNGGTFYVANQSFSLTNAHDISAVFVVELPLRNKDGRPEIRDCFEPGVIDLSGLYYEPSSGHIFIISDSCNILLEYTADHELVNEFAFPGENQEGITMDDDDYVYTAQDSGGIIKRKWLRND